MQQQIKCKNKSRVLKVQVQGTGNTRKIQVAWKIGDPAEEQQGMLRNAEECQETLRNNELCQGTLKNAEEHRGTPRNTKEH